MKITTQNEPSSEQPPKSAQSSLRSPAHQPIKDLVEPLVNPYAQEMNQPVDPAAHLVFHRDVSFKKIETGNSSVIVPGEGPDDQNQESKDAGPQVRVKSELNRNQDIE